MKPKLSLSERTYRCNQCRLVIDRDLNAAINIATAAIAASDAVPLESVAGGRPETLNARRAHVRPTLIGRPRALKREDLGGPLSPGPPRRSNPAALAHPGKSPAAAQAGQRVVPDAIRCASAATDHYGQC